LAKSSQSWNKKEREKQKAKERQEKEARKKERKENASGGKSLDDMMAYIDENGNITDTPPDPSKRAEVNVEDIVIGVPKRAAADENPIRTGVVSFFNTAKGYGFIRDLETGESIFVHVNDLTEEVKENTRVQFEVEMGHKGPQAVRVKKS